jgi:DeoR family suf operon transcriptional repressor
MTSLLRQQATDKAGRYRQTLGTGSLRHRVERLAELRRQEGYVTELHQDTDGQSWCLSEFHCSVQRIAEEYPVVCDQELELIRQTFADCRVERVHWRLKEGHSCGFRITPGHG